jgi:hypothetical protein
VVAIQEAILQAWAASMPDAEEVEDESRPIKAVG